MSHIITKDKIKTTLIIGLASSTKDNKKLKARITIDDVPSVDYQVNLHPNPDMGGLVFSTQNLDEAIDKYNSM